MARPTLPARIPGLRPGWRPTFRPWFGSAHRHAMRTITVLTPIRDDAVALATDRLAGLGQGSSPFAASDRTHFARLLVLPTELRRYERPTGMRRYAKIIDLIAHLGRQQQDDPLSRPYLVFSAGYDDDPTTDVYAPDHSSYVEHLRRRLAATADRIWDTCDGYPGWQDAARFGAYFADHIVAPAYIFAPAQTATVGRVRDALRLRDQVLTLAVAAQHASDAELRKRFAEVFEGPEAAAAPSTTPPARPATSASAIGGQAAAESLDEAAEWNGWALEDLRRYPRLPRSQPLGRLDLDDVQGLATGYPTHLAAAFLFLRITDPDVARAWLATTPVTTATQARAVIDARKAGQPAETEVARHVAVSHRGLLRLGVGEERLAGFDRSFRAGMALRERSLAPGLGTGVWQEPYRPGPGEPAAVDVLVHLSAPDPSAIGTALADLRDDVRRTGAFVEVAVEQGTQMPDPTSPPGVRRYLEHFGFADGGSQPAIDGLKPAAPGNLPTGELLLGHPDVDGDTAGATAPPELAHNGSYLVFRKLEQDVPAFRALCSDDDELAAKLVGRRQNAVALTATGAADADYQFDAEDPDGFHCPVGSHVRRVSPRDSRPLAVGPAEPDRKDPVEPKLARRHRMLRRGIPYGDPLPAGGERGLLFVALVGDIGRQFEFVQTQWMNDGHSFRLGADPDVFAGVAGPGRKVTVQGRPPTFVEVPRPVVTCRGGEYFLLPGIAALRSLTQPRA